VEIDRRVPAFLGRILDDEGHPVGTCFQVRPGVLVTAWHVLNDAGQGEEGARVQLDPLQGGPVRDARVKRIDQSHDLAVVMTEKPLAESVAGVVSTDEVPQATPVAVTGVVIVNDPGHSYSHFDTNGHWAGGTTRDGNIKLGRMVAEALMKGMSGAPVLSGAFAVGVVSARYNSADEWARNSVWIARTEDLVPLLAGLGDIAAPLSGSTSAAMRDSVSGQVYTAPRVAPQGMSAIAGDGVFVVGLDIKPGVYRTAGPVPGRNGYYALLSSTNTSDIINNNNIAGPATMTVGPDVKAVSVSGCQPWLWQGASLDEAIASVRREPQDAEVLGSVMGGDGVFVVGLDIKPGVYRTAGPVPGRNGYYALLSSTNTSDIINNNNIAGPATMTVGPDVKAVSVSGCQPWLWQGASLDEAIEAARQKSADPERVSVNNASWIALIGELEARLDLDNWDFHVGGLLRSSNGMHSSSNARLHDLARWLQGRIFPDNQEELRRALMTLYKVAVDLLETFGRHTEVPRPEQEDPWLRTAQFYKLDRGNLNAVERYEGHINIISDLTLELTRVVNWICDIVRRNIDPAFRFQQGAVQVEGGPYSDSDTRWFRPEYSLAELSAAADPYGSLEDFMTTRHTRDLHT
jgi:hypothetical protein